MRYTLYIILISITLLGCKKKEVQTYYISDYLKHYSIFQFGSYWIFKNETTSMIDSSFIKSPPFFHFYQNYQTDPIMQICDIEYGGNFILGSQITYGNYYLSLKPGPGGSCLRDPFQPGWFEYNGYNELLKDVQAYDTLIINNIIFTNVLCTQILQFHTQKRDTSYYTFYFCKSVGLIKYNKRLYNSNDSTWSLLRFHVIQ